jgi:uncharacterized protein (TIGR03000 family)
MKGLSRSPLALVVVLSAVFAVGAQDKNKGKAKEEAATLVVKLEEDDAELIVDGTPLKGTGKERSFKTPPLEVGKKFEYTVTAKWEPNNYTKITRKRKAVVEAGKTTTLDLTKADPKQPDDIVIRYVPTPQTVVDAMLKLGKAGKDDVVYDLGCGDGRIVVTAVKKFDAKKGVGIDIEPDRIKESNANAKEADVVGKVEFRLGDVMKIKDLENATVVTTYLGDELNEQLRPILQKRLRNGARIVSHRFLMGDWKPEKTETLTVDGEKYLIHLWTIKKKDETEKKEEKKEDKKKEDKKGG